MFQWLNRVIGQVQATIRDVFFAILQMGCPNGGFNNIAKHQHQPAKQGSKVKQSRAQQVKQDQSHKTETSPVRIRTKQSQEIGTPQQTPVKTPVKSKPKVKRSLAQSTTPAPLHKLVKQLAQVDNGEIGKRPVTPAPRIPRLAKTKSKPKL